MLGKNDILVTNHKDKQEQIPKILAVNEEVKRTFSKGGHARAAHQLQQQSPLSPTSCRGRQIE